MRRSVIDRFVLMTKKAKDGCTLWTGGKLRGYGSFNIGGKTVSAHRVAYEFFVGSIPDGLFVLHRCDCRPCVNPSHLWLGTGQDNMDDMVRKGRQAVQKGSRHGRAKITEEDAAEIRRRCISGELQRMIAMEFGIDRSQVSNIVNNKYWRS